ncbi:MAG: hypothetical protein PQJ49_10515 [Sphaerochaetaceae bacterium]|nr:hypothetical protein [Sphaerochaetaceae bacterium]
MLNSQQVENINKQLRLKGTRLSVTRDKERSVYTTTEGKNALTRLIVTGGLFNKMNCSEGEVAIHNLVVGILEECGFLDEKNIKSIVDFLFTLPLIDKELDRL